MKKKLPKSLKKFIRNQKAKIRKGVDSSKQKDLLQELNNKFPKK